MQKSIETIQLKADQIYNKFKSYFAYQVRECFLHRLELLGIFESLASVPIGKFVQSSFHAPIPMTIRSYISIVLINKSGPGRICDTL
jgi:hypothetical protein